MTYCTISQCFTKAFFSIKGTYYQVEIMGQKITWIAPYQFNQRLPFEIDYKVIGTFREFYVALLRFVNFKLFKDLGLPYPPKDVKGISTDFLDEGNQIYLRTDQMRQLQAIAQKKFQEEYEDSVEKIGVSDEFKNTPEMVALTKKHEEMKRQRRLFSKCTFLLNREVPIYGLQYLILSFGGAFYS
jgi:pescadillo protein